MKNRAIEKRRDVGMFVVRSGGLAVCDDYAIGDEVKSIDDALTGEWRGSVGVSDEGEFDERIAWLLVEAKEGKPVAPWERQPFAVPVEGGRLCVCDADAFRAKSGDQRWHDRCSVITDCCLQAGAFKGGVVSSSGYGDGNYDCHVRRDKDGKAVAVMVDFGLARGRRIMGALCRR